MTPRSKAALERIHSLQDYYDWNTLPFLLSGKRKKSGAIHRAVWGPGVESKNAALSFTTQLIAREIKPITESTDTPVKVLDVGCGVGGMAMQLLETHPLDITGITLSIRQKELGEERISAAGLSKSCHIICDDFLTTDLLSPVRMLYAVESFQHMDNIFLFFSQARSLLESGGLIVLCDDFLSSIGRRPQIDIQPWLSMFELGWRLKPLFSLEETVQTARLFGLKIRAQIDLSSYLHLAPKAIPYLVRYFRGLLGRHPYIDSLLGGYAGQYCYHKQLVSYQMLVFTKN